MNSETDRGGGAETGALIGDALAMPAHWYYDTAALRETFRRLDTYRDPPQDHPTSILWRSSYEPREPQFDILGAERPFWGQRNVHYHRLLRAGENTLNLQLLTLALADVRTRGGYDVQRYRSAYIEFLRHPEGHRDTYLEECHRGFFVNLRRGVPPERCAVQEKHIGGMVAVLPLWALLRTLGESDSAARLAVHQHVGVTHAGEMVRTAVDTLLVLAAELWEGVPLKEALTAHLRRQDLPYLQGPIERLATKNVPEVIGPTFSPACYLQDAMPATFYLALRYHDDPETALVENAMAGGDNCHRGAVLGALLGLAGGRQAFPQRWLTGLIPQR